MSSVNKANKFHLEIQTHRKNPYGLIRTTYRDENNKIIHKTVSRITGLDFQTLKLIQAAMQGNVVLKEDFSITRSREYGASCALLQLAKELGLDRILYSRTSELWVRDCLAMIIGRVIYAGSKLSLTTVSKDSCLWELCGIMETNIDVNHHCYEAMDELLKRQETIQKKLARKHLNDNAIILYDITSSYLEGEYQDSSLVEYGYNRDKKRGHAQIVIGLICNKDGCPVAVEVFKGNTKDENTVQNKIHEIKDMYGVKDAIFVGDRGMVTKTQFDIMQEDEKDYIKTISALTHARLKELCAENNIQVTMLDKVNVIEVTMPEQEGIRYAVSWNPVRAEKDKDTRQKLIQKTETELEKVVALKRKKTDGEMGIRVGKVINKYKVGKYFKVSIENGKLTYSLDQAAIDEDEKFDGFYAIFTDVDEKDMTIQEALESYRKLVFCEQSFRNLKNPQLAIRPIFHRNDDRIKCHVFICMLSYYLLWHMNQRLSPLTKEDDDGKNQKYTVKHIIERLKSIRKEEIDFSDIKTEIITEPDEEQQQFLDLIGVKIK